LCFFKKVNYDNLFSEAYENLTTRDPEKFWTSGQWMTEKAGGSDVGQATATEAVFNEKKGIYELYGYKWFTSAITSDITLTLGRVHDENEVTEGSKG
jgi:alkylation response protein AidB-like acyl-CoA dehydrogenase